MFKKKMFLWFYLPVILGLFIFSGCGVTTPVTVTGVTLDGTAMTLIAGGATGTLVATVAPVDATNQSVNWSSTALVVATVVDGVVTPLTAGTTTIIATTVDGGLTATCTVIVNPALLAIGDSYGGGIVAYIFKDNGNDPDDPGYVEGEIHGLIAATEDQSDGIAWITGGNTQHEWVNGTDSTGTSTALGEGQANTNAMKAQTGYTGGAAKVCDDYSVTVGGITYTDWFLPSKDELNELFLNKGTIGSFAGSHYWSSSEGVANYAWNQFFNGGYQSNYEKDNVFWVRAVRVF